MKWRLEKELETLCFSPQRFHKKSIRKGTAAKYTEKNWKQYISASMNESICFNKACIIIILKGLFIWNDEVGCNFLTISKNETTKNISNSTLWKLSTRSAVINFLFLSRYYYSFFLYFIYYLEHRKLTIIEKKSVKFLLSIIIQAFLFIIIFNKKILDSWTFRRLCWQPMRSECDVHRFGQRFRVSKLPERIQGKTMPYQRFEIFLLWKGSRVICEKILLLDKIKSLKHHRDIYVFWLFFSCS